MEAEGIVSREPLRSAERSSATGLQEIVQASGISLRLWRLYAQAWLICLLFPILTLVHLRPPLLLASAGLAVFAVSYARIMWRHPIRAQASDYWPARSTYLLLSSLVALVLVLSLAYGSAFLWLLVGVSAMAGVLLPPLGAFVMVMVLTLLTLGSGVALAGGLEATDWLHLIPLVLLVRGLGLDMAGLVRLASALREVHAARGELTRMAVVEERLRMARDLHDLLGHTLSMITLKSELAQRLVNQNPARAAAEMREVEQTARQTLREVRAAVAGYRQPTLQRELHGARQLLEAAGIEYTIEQAHDTLPAAVDAAFAWIVREAITNVIRHSRATWCRIRIQVAPERATAEIVNDRMPGPGSQSGSSSTGTGLANLAERVAMHGGQLTAGLLPADDNCFHLYVELPIRDGGDVGSETR